MVGTAVNHVGSASRSHDPTFVPWNGGQQERLPPAASDDSSDATSPWTWKSGMSPRHRSRSVSWRTDVMDAIDARRLARVSGTSFGRLVVPEVCRTRAESSGSAGFAGAAPAAPARTRRGANAPAGPRASSSSATTAIPRAAATSRPRASAAVPSPATTTIAGLRSPRKKSSSDVVKRGFSGADANAALIPRKATAATGPFGRTLATTSPPVAPCPSRNSLNPVICRSSSAWVSGSRLGASMCGRVRGRWCESAEQ